MKLLPLMILLSVKDVLWPVVSSCFSGDGSFYFLSLGLEKTTQRKAFWYSKAFLTPHFHLARFHSSKPSSALSHLNTITKNDNKYLKKSV